MRDSRAMRCAACGYERNPDGEPACGMCRAPLRAAPAAPSVEAPPTAPTSSPAPIAPKPAPPVRTRRPGLGDLGPRVSVYKVSALYSVGAPLLGVALLACAAACAFGINDEGARWSGGLLFGAFGGVALVGGLSTRGVVVSMHKNGLLREQGSAYDAVLWDDVKAVFREIVRTTVNGVPTGTTFTYKVRSRDGRELLFGSDLVGIEALGEELQGVLKRRLLPGAIEAFDRGEIVEFGEVSVSQKGVRLRTDRLLGWPSLGKLDVQEGYLVLGRDDASGSDRIEVSRIPNLLLFFALVQHGVRTSA